MADQAPRPCLHPGCPRLQTQRHRCELHQPIDSRAGANVRYGKTWQKDRASVLRRDGYLCQRCRVRPAKEVDHITPRSQGGTNDLWNLQSLCRPCHREKSLLEAQAKRLPRPSERGDQA